MVGYILLAILLLLILLIFFVPYGVDAAYRDGQFTLKVAAGPIRLRLYPKKPLTPRQLARREKKEAKKAAKAAAKAAQQEENKARAETDATEKVKAKKKLDLSFDFVMALLKMAAHAIRRFFRSFTVDLFQLHCTVATDDPYNTAMQYANICAAVEALPSLCGSVIRVRRRDIQIGSDFTAEKPTFSGRIVLTLQLFRLVHLAVAFGVEFITWKLKNRSKPAAEDTERKEDNGKQDQ